MTAVPPVPHGARLKGVLGLVLVVMTWIAYYPVSKNDLVDFDDETFITENEHVCSGLTADGCSWALFNDEPPYRMPITWLTLQCDAELSAWIAPGSARPLPQIVHAQNLLWHSVNALLLFSLCLRLPGATCGRAFLVSALFAIHPMHVESVAWGIERKDVLMCAFGLLSILAYLRFVETKRRLFYVCSLVALAMSLGAKPMLLTMPFVLLLLDYWPLRQMRSSLPVGSTITDHGTRFFPLLLEKWPFFVLAFAVAVETTQTRSGTSLGSIGLIDRLMNALAGYGWYISTTLWPAPLAAVYPHPHENWSWEASLTGAGLLVSVTALALRQARVRPWLFVGWFWFVGTLFPLIGFAQGGPQAWADRFSYWPHIGLLIALVWGATELGARLRIPVPVARAFWTAAIVGLMLLTSIQVSYWRDSVILWEHTVEVTKDNLYAHERLSLAYRRQGRTVEADFHMLEANRLMRARMEAARLRFRN